MDFTIRSALSFGWKTFKKRPWFFMGSSLVIAVIYAVFFKVAGAITVGFGGPEGKQAWPGALFFWLVAMLIAMGITAFYLAAHDKPEAVKLSALWHPRPFWRFAGVFISILLVIGISFGIGLGFLRTLVFFQPMALLFDKITALLLFAPVIIVTLLLMFAPLVVIDRGLGPIKAMKESVRIGRGYRWSALGLLVLLAIVLLAGPMAFFVGFIILADIIAVYGTATFGIFAFLDLALLVGLLVAIPVMSLAFMHAYRVLSAKAEQTPNAAVADAQLGS